MKQETLYLQASRTAEKIGKTGKNIIFCKLGFRARQPFSLVRKQGLLRLLRIKDLKLKRIKTLVNSRLVEFGGEKV